MREDKLAASESRQGLLFFLAVLGVVLLGAAPVFGQATPTIPVPATPKAAGKLVIAPQFEEAWPFSEGLARVKQNGKWGFVDRTGAFVVAPSFEDAESFSEERAEIKLNGKWGFIDKSGKVIVAPEFEETRRFTEGLAAVRPKGKWGYIDKTGAMAIPPTFKSARSFSDGLAAVVVNWGLGALRWKFVDTKGKVAIESINVDPKHDDEVITFAAEFSEGLAKACHEGTCFLINKAGRPLTPPFSSAVARIWGLSEGLTSVMKAEKWGKAKTGFLDKMGSVVIPYSFGEHGWVTLDEAVGAVNVYRDLYLMDKTEMPIELPSLWRRYVFAEGLAAVELNHKWGFIDKAGTMVIPASFDEAYRFSGGLALVVDRTGFKPASAKSSVQVGVYGYIDRTAATVIGPYPLQSDRGLSTLKDCSEGLAPVVIDGKWGYASPER